MTESFGGKSGPTQLRLESTVPICGTETAIPSDCEASAQPNKQFFILSQPGKMPQAPTVP